MSATRPSISLPARYRVVRHIASGGMAAVYEAHDELLDRKVAVKVLAAHLNEDERARRRFEREARAAAGLSSHPHVVTIYDVGEHEDRSFIVMELMCCGTLADRLRDGRPSHDKALSWLRDAASALDAAHAADVVHRDIKPANLLLDERDRLAIADFGIARLAYDDQVTQTGQVLGTASYLAPEQAMGARTTAASDRYALAVVAFELLTGHRPFPHEHFAAQARAHVEEPPPAASALAPDLPAAVDAVLARGLAKEPAERWPTATEFVAALGEVLGSAPVAAVAEPPATEPTRRMAPVAAPPQRTPPPAGRAAAPPAGAPRSRWPVVAALVGLLLAAIAVGAVLSGEDDGTDPAPEPTPRAEQERKTPEPTATAETTPESTPEATATPDATQPDEAAASRFNDEGFALLSGGDPAAAVEPLRKAYAACEGSTAVSPCAYALFNLGRALRLSGSPAEAVPILEERLQRFPQDQRGTVEQELALARQGVTADGEGADEEQASGAGKAKGKYKNKDD